MEPLVVWLVVALVLGAVVLVLAAASTRGGEGLGGFVRDLRAGVSERWARLRGRPLPAEAEVPAELIEPVETTIDDFFAATQVDGDPYVHVADISGALTAAKAKVVDGVHHLTRR